MGVQIDTQMRIFVPRGPGTPVGNGEGAAVPGRGLNWGPYPTAALRSPGWLLWSSQSYCCEGRMETAVCPPSPL